MLGKFLVTAVVIYIAYLVIRSRYQGSDQGADQGPGQDSRIADRSGVQSSKPTLPALPLGAVKVVAYATVALMVFGSGFYLFQSWDRQHQVVEVQVINPYSGQVQRYEVRRGDIEGRTFRTLDGRLIRIAEMERLVIDEVR
ncbi:MAG: hypothetical protein WBM40_23990 [Thiohalocapsa sp.]